MTKGGCFFSFLFLLRSTTIPDLTRRRGPGHGGEVDGAVDIPGEPSVPARDHDRGLADRPSGGGGFTAMKGDDDLPLPGIRRRGGVGVTLSFLKPFF